MSRIKKPLLELEPAEEQGRRLFHDPDEIEAVPTAPELAAQGLAEVVARSKTGAATHYRLTAEGQQMVFDAMKRNAQRRLDRGKD
jgi:hypothetical protein